MTDTSKPVLTSGMGNLMNGHGQHEVTTNQENEISVRMSSDGQLPPPLYPSDHRSTPSSTNSFSAPKQVAVRNHGAMHHPQPSVKSIVFGGYTESSSPSPTSADRVQNVSFTGGTSPVHFVAPNHSPHYPDLNMPQVYPPNPLQQTSTSRFPIQPQFSRPPTFFNPEANFFPRSAMNQGNARHFQHMTPNGEPLSRSASQASSQAHEIRERPISHSGSEALESRSPKVNDITSPTSNGSLRVAQSRNSFALPNHPGRPHEADLQLDLEAALAVRGYLLVNFGNPDYADYVLEIAQSEDANPSVALPLHGLLLSRSPALLAMINDRRRKPLVNHDGLKILRINSMNDKFFVNQAFIEALQYLYGAPLLNIQNFLRVLPPFENSGSHSESAIVAQQMMTHALGYASAGHVLQLPIVTFHGLQFAREILRWDNVEQALEFAFGAKVTDDFLQSFTHHILKFIIFNFPPQFSFQTSAPQLAGCPRLPSVAEPRTSISDPRVSRLTFGELQFADTPVADPASTTLSSILVSLPFAALKRLLQDPTLTKHITAAEIIELAHQVVDEREKRRRKVLKSKCVVTGTDELLWDEAKWEETVGPHDGPHTNGIMLNRVMRHELKESETVDETAGMA